MYNLTKREIEVLRLITEGCGNGEIAERLYVSTETAKWHSASIINKLGVKNRIQAAIKAIKENLV